MSASSVGQHAVERPRRASPAVPSRAYAQAISVPDAPAPITAIDAGSSLSAHASSVPITLPPNSRPGIGFLTEPVASTTPLAAVELVVADLHVAVRGQRAEALDVGRSRSS